MTEKLCKVCGKIPTNHPSGTCVMCMINGALPAQASQRELQSVTNSKFKIQDLNMAAKVKEKVMPVTEENKSRKCSVEGCEKYAFRGGMCLKDYNEAHGIQKRLGRKLIVNNGKCSVEGCDNTVKSGGLCYKHYLRELKASGRIGKNKRGSQAVRQKFHKSPDIIGTASTPEPATKDDLLAFCLRGAEDNGNYTISIDFTAYPKLHETLLKLADEDFRNPGQQLLSMLHNTLKDAEART